MAVFLTILKIIGLALAAIIALALLIVIIVLFVPIRYKVHAQKKEASEEYRAKANVSFLLHVFSATFGYDKEFDKCVRLFGIKIWPRQPKHEEDSNEVKPESVPPQDGYTIDRNEEESAADSKGEEEVNFVKEPEKPEESEEPEDGLSDKVGKIIDKIISKYENLRAKYDKIKKEIRFWDRMIHDERNQNAAELIKNKLIKLLRIIRPRRVKGFIHFGFDDPATLGRILAYLSVIYPVLPRKLRLEPDFEHADIYGDIVIKGHFSLIVFVAVLVRLYFNRDIRRMLRLYRRHKNR